MYLRVTELLGWQGDGTHAPFLRVMIDTCEEGLWFWVRRYLPTPAHSHDSIASSTFKFRHPDSPLNLYHPAKPSYVVKSDLTEVALCGLMLIAAIHISECVCVNPNYAPARYIWTQTAISEFDFFFHTKTLLATCQPCTAEPGLGNLSSALKCQLSTAQMPKAPWGVYGQPCSPSPYLCTTLLPVVNMQCCQCYVLLPLCPPSCWEFFSSQGSPWTRPAPWLPMPWDGRTCERSCRAVQGQSVPLYLSKVRVTRDPTAADGRAIGCSARSSKQAWCVSAMAKMNTPNN